MLPKNIPTKVQNAFGAMGTVISLLGQYPAWVEAAGGNACDFAAGNPHDIAHPDFVKALQSSTEPHNKDWYAYKMNELSATETVAKTLRQQFGRNHTADDIFMTNGATGALNVAFNTLCDPGDEALFMSPPWFFYEAMVRNAGAIPVKVPINYETFDLDLNAIEAAITEKTRFVLVNSPHNPTGKIYPPETLRGLADIMTRASEKFGRIIYLLSDEAYRRILFDGNTFYSPTDYYPNSLMLYTYGKTLLTPGQRLGYIALNPEMDELAEMRLAMTGAQIINGYVFPNALLQHALPAIEPLSIDMEHMQAKRDRMVTILRDAGYEVHVPEATFYLLPKSPMADSVAFTERLVGEGIIVLPGDAVEMPDYFRISLTANDDMIERSIPAWAAVNRPA